MVLTWPELQVSISDQLQRAPEDQHPILQHRAGKTLLPKTRLAGLQDASQSTFGC